MNRKLGKRKIRVSTRRGLAVIMVLMVIALLSTIAFSTVKLCRNDQLETTSEHRYAVARCAAQGGLHRGVALLRRNKNLRGNLDIRGTTLPAGAGLQVNVQPLGSTSLLITSTVNYRGISIADKAIVDSSRL